MTDGEPETAVSASLQKIKSIKNQHKHIYLPFFRRADGAGRVRLLKTDTKEGAASCGRGVGGDGGCCRVVGDAGCRRVADDVAARRLLSGRPSCYPVPAPAERGRVAGSRDGPACTSRGEHQEHRRLELPS